MDTADREKYQSLTAHYYRRANIVLLVCAMDDELTLNRLTKWHQEAQHYIDNDDVIYAVCAIKSDLQPHEKEVTIEQLQSFADHAGFRPNCIFQVSSKTGAGVANMLKTVCSVATECLETRSDNYCKLVYIHVHVHIYTRMLHAFYRIIMHSRNS